MRTDYLRQARAAFDRGQLFADELKAAEDKLSVENRPSIDRFRFVKEQEDESTVANPCSACSSTFEPGGGKLPGSFFAALSQILQQELPCGLDLYANVVFDNVALFLFRHDDQPADGAV